MAFCVKGLPFDKEKLTLNAMSEKSKKTKTDSEEGRMHRMLRMTIFVDKSFAPIFTMRFTPLSLVVGGAATILVLITGVTLLIAFTGLREYIPGYPTGEERLIAINKIEMSVDKVLEAAKTITTIRVRMPENGTFFTKTLFLTEKHLAIKSLFDLSGSKS